MLAEIVVAVQFRRSNVKLDTIRQAHQFAREHFEVAYPLLSKTSRCLAAMSCMSFPCKTEDQRYIEQ